MRSRSVLLAGTSLLAMTAHASADPVFTPLTLALFSGPLGAVLGPAAIYTGLQVLTATAISLGSALLSGQRGAADPNRLKQVTQGAEGPGRYATGRVIASGKVAFGNTAGYDIYKLILHCFGELDAVEEYYYDGRAVVVDEDGSVSSPPFGNADGSYLNIRTKVGDGTETSWDPLKLAFPDLWTSAHRVRGIAQSLTKFTNPGTGSPKFAKLLTGGVKEVTAKVRAGQFYDPRYGSTDWTLNGVIQCLHWFRQLPYVTDDQIDFDAIALVADEADEAVATLTGTAPRCQISGGWEGPITTDIVLDMLDSAGLEVRTTDAGLYTFAFIEDDPESELTLYSRHIIDRQTQAGPEAAQRPNIAKLSFFSPERGFEIAQIDTSGAAWAIDAADNGKYGDQEADIKLTFCPDASQGQRICRRKFHMSRAASGTVVTTFAGLAAWGKRVITIEIPDVGEDGDSAFVKIRIEAPRINDAEGTVEIPYTEIPAILTTPWNAATDEVAAPPVLEDLEYASELDTPAAPSEATVVQYPDLSFETRVRYAGVTDGTEAEANFRTYTGGLPNAWQSMTEYEGMTAWFAWAATDARSQADFRVRFFNDDDEGSYFSEALEKNPLAIDNTAPGAPAATLTAQTGTTPAYFTITAPELNVTHVTLEHRIDGGSWVLDGTSDVRPEISVDIDLPLFGLEPDDRTLDWRVTSYTSDDTPGAQATGSFLIPGTGTP